MALVVTGVVATESSVQVASAIGTSFSTDPVNCIDAIGEDATDSTMCGGADDVKQEGFALEITTTEDDETVKIPVGGYAAYDWSIDWGVDGESPTKAKGSASSYRTISHVYAKEGVHTVIITPNYTGSAPAQGWFDAFGAFSSEDVNITALLTPFSMLARTPGNGFSSTFADMPYIANLPSNLFSGVDTSLVTDFTRYFYRTFYNYASDSASATIPATLFDSIDTASGTVFSYMFYYTFYYYAESSESATIPEGLFGELDTSNGIDFSYMFYYTFYNAFENSESATIPTGLFSEITSTKGTDFRYMFGYTFCETASSSDNATIPDSLFGAINPSGEADFSNMFSGTFNYYATASSSANIPASMFSAINTTNGINFSSMFSNTFNHYAGSSTSGTIPAGLFSTINTANGTAFSSMFNRTFDYFAQSSHSASIPAGLFSAINTSKGTDFSSMFNYTFYSYAEYYNASITIPDNLFSAINTSKGTNFSSMFEGTFYWYAYQSTAGDIPANLFSAINTSKGTDFSYMFEGTFSYYSASSTSGTIPANIFGAINTSNGTRFYGMFSGTFSAYAQSSASAGVPENLFSTINTSKGTDFGSMFARTFYEYAEYSTSANIPAKLFDKIVTSNGTDFNNMFYATFSYYARHSTSATIPSGLFDKINTSNGTDFSYMFENTFLYYAGESTVGTIPSKLFDKINTSKGTSFGGMFEYTFYGYAKDSTVGTIPSGLFDKIDTSNGTSFYNMFRYTFLYYAQKSTTATIPTGLFDKINTSKGTYFYNMFAGTFDSYAIESTVANIPAKLFDKIDTSNGTDFESMFSSTFSNYAQKSTTATIPSGLFDAINTSKGTYFYGMFNGTFSNYAQKSTSANIPAKLFDKIDTSKGYTFNYMFDATFASYAPESSVATIPAGLFDKIDTSRGTALNYMFYDTFSDYAWKSTSANIPTGLFDKINTSKGVNFNGMFRSTFDGYAQKSTQAVIPAKLFDKIDTSNGTVLTYMFASTFRNYANSRSSLELPNDLFKGINTTKATDTYGIYRSTFDGYPSAKKVATFELQVDLNRDGDCNYQYDDYWCYSDPGYYPKNPSQVPVPQLLDQAVTKPTSDPTGSGWTFKHWSTTEQYSGSYNSFTSNAGSETAYTFESPVTDNVALYAVWNNSVVLNTYYNVVSFYADKIEPYSTERVMSGTTAKEVSSDSVAWCYYTSCNYSGFDFKGWSRNAETFTAYDFNTPVTSYIELFPFWDEHTVVFNPNNGNGSTTRRVKGGEAITNVPTPSRSDYVFIGWYTAQDGGTKFDFSTLIDQDYTFYAHWAQIPQVQFSTDPQNCYGATGTPASNAKCGGADKPSEEAFQLEVVTYDTNDTVKLPAGGFYYVNGESDRAYFDYDWDIYWDATDATATRATGNSYANYENPSIISHTYATAGTHTVTIKPHVNAGSSVTKGWLDAFGNSFRYDGSDIRITKILTPFPALSRIPEHGFHFTFYGFTNLNDLPSNLFASVDTSQVTDFSRMFDYTFYNTSQLSTTATIPAELFSELDTSSGTNFNFMFSYTFESYASRSLDATIPQGLFSALSTGNGENFFGMFYGTFYTYARNSQSATIPADLFDAIDTSKATVTRNMYDSQTFYQYPHSSNIVMFMLQAPIADTPESARPVPAPQFVATGDKVTKPEAIPTATDTSFIYWSNDAPYDYYGNRNSICRPYDFDEPIMSSGYRSVRYIYARWENNCDSTVQHTITFDSQGGSAIYPLRVIDGYFATPPTPPIRANFTFDGWYTAATAGEKFDFSATEITEDITLYAHWIEIQMFTVTFDSQGGTVVGLQTVANGATAVQPKNPTRTAYTFQGWYTAATGGTKFSFGTKITQNLTLYAHWTLTPVPAPKPTPTPAVSAIKKLTVKNADYETKFKDIGDLNEGRQDAIQWMYQYGITIGSGGPNTYKPAAKVNRGAMAEFLHKLRGLAKTTKKVPKISDLQDLSKARVRSIKWLASEKITVIKSNKYNPKNVVNRGAMAEFLYKVVGSLTYKPSSSDYKKIKDISLVESNSGRKKAIAWLVKNKISILDKDGKYNPQNPVNRGAMAEFMMKLYKKFAE
ncbi:MAG: InlB B-repeat-containing protein [Bifidobacteriaceae bacterium]|nr:InlB B-repeat-containing protein [Bifidobacteriaceae bacterium]